MSEVNMIKTAKFLELAQTPEGQSKFASIATPFIKSQIREGGVARKLFDFNKVSLGDPKVRQKLDRDELEYLVDLEPDSAAMVANFRGTAPSKYINMHRVAMGFGAIKGRGFRKTVEELMAIGYDIKKYISDYTAIDMRREEDRIFFQMMDACVNDTGKLVDASTVDYLDKTHFMKLKKLLTTDKLPATKFICAEADLDDLITWQTADIGFNVPEKIMTSQDGTAQIYKVLYGLDVITSANAEYFRDASGNRVFYVVGDKDKEGNNYFGVGKSITDVTFWTERRENMIEVGAWESIGMAIVNNRSVGKLILKNS